MVKLQHNLLCRPKEFMVVRGKHSDRENRESPNLIKTKFKMEIVEGFRANTNTYVDKDGYTWLRNKFNKNTQTSYMKCFQPDCPARCTIKNKVIELRSKHENHTMNLGPKKVLTNNASSLHSAPSIVPNPASNHNAQEMYASNVLDSGPNPAQVDHLRFLEKMRHRAATTSEPLHSIFSACQREHELGASVAGNFYNCEDILKAARATRSPSLSKSLEQLDAAMKDSS